MLLMKVVRQKDPNEPPIEAIKRVVQEATEEKRYPPNAVFVDSVFYNWIEDKNVFGIPIEIRPDSFFMNHRPCVAILDVSDPDEILE